MGITSVIIGIILWGFLSFITWKYFKSTTLSNYTLPAMALKFLSGIIIGLVYIEYYKAGDTLLYYEDAKVLREFFFHSPKKFIQFIIANHHLSDLDLSYGYSSPRALLFSKITGIILLFSGDNYYVCSLYFSLFSFSGMAWLVIALSKVIPGARIYAIIAFLFFPSVVFWTSGIIKESIAVGALAFFLGITLPWAFSISKLNTLKAVGALLSFVILWKLKYYYAGLLFPLLFSTVLLLKVPVFNNILTSSLKSTIVWLTLISITFFVITMTKINFNLTYLPQVIIENHDAFIAKSSPNDYVKFDNLTADWEGISRNTPLALISGLFRPNISDIEFSPKIFACLENFLLLLLMVFNLKNIVPLWKSKFWLTGLSAISYIMLLAVFLSLSTPNFGTLTRYKAGFLFLFVFLVLYKNPVLKFLKKKIE
ncbi:MAG: hypothetical protein OEX02_04240 [Cyclobacteriaceae bacterium]|nr:hypothetical protein [Cyclobacteriaceae bacterium]